MALWARSASFRVLYTQGPEPTLYLPFGHFMTGILIFLNIMGAGGGEPPPPINYPSGSTAETPVATATGATAEELATDIGVGVS